MGEGAESSSEGEESELCGSGGLAGRFGGVENVVPRLLAGRSARSTQRGQRALCVMPPFAARSSNSERNSPSRAGPRSSIGSATPPNPRPACVGSATDALICRTVYGLRRGGDKETARSLPSAAPNLCLTDEQRVPKDRHGCRVECGLERERVAPSSTVCTQLEALDRRPG